MGKRILVAGLMMLCLWQGSALVAQPRRLSGGLSVQAVWDARQARPGNKNPAVVAVAVNWSKGPLNGLAADDFELQAAPLPQGGCGVEKTGGFSSGFPGRYFLEVVPVSSEPSCSWQAGEYIVSIHVSRARAAGTGVSLLTIPEPEEDDVAACSGTVCRDALEVKTSSTELPAGFSGVYEAPCPDGFSTVWGRAIAGPGVVVPKSGPGILPDGRIGWFTTWANTGPGESSLTMNLICLRIAGG